MDNHLHCSKPQQRNQASAYIYKGETAEIQSLTSTEQQHSPATFLYNSGSTEVFRETLHEVRGGGGLWLLILLNSLSLHHRVLVNV
jgi:hypothetical protein